MEINIKTKKSNGQDTIAYYHHDHLGTPIQATDKNGKVVWAARYDAFGRASIVTPQATAENPTITSNLRLPGQYEDQETGLHYNWNRYYDPTIGRYVTEDPIGLLGGVGIYIYANGSPTLFLDPLGLCIQKATAEGLAGAFGGFVSGWVGSGFNPWMGAASAVVGGISGYASSGQGPWSTAGIGAIAGGVTGGSWYGIVGGTISGGMSAGLATHDTTFPNASAGAFGGFAGGVVAGSLYPSIGNNPRPFTMPVLGAVSGYLGGMAQDVMMYFLMDHLCGVCRAP